MPVTTWCERFTTVAARDVIVQRREDLADMYDDGGEVEGGKGKQRRSRKPRFSPTDKQAVDRVAARLILQVRCRSSLCGHGVCDDSTHSVRSCMACCPCGAGLHGSISPGREGGQLKPSVSSGHKVLAPHYHTSHDGSASALHEKLACSTVSFTHIQHTGTAAHYIHHTFNTLSTPSWMSKFPRSTTPRRTCGFMAATWCGHVLAGSLAPRTTTTGTVTGWP